MSTCIRPLAGHPAPASVLVDAVQLAAAEFPQRPDAGTRAPRRRARTDDTAGKVMDAA